MLTLYYDFIYDLSLIKIKVFLLLSEVSSYHCTFPFKLLTFFTVVGGDGGVDPEVIADYEANQLRRRVEPSSSHSREFTAPPVISDIKLIDKMCWPNAIDWVCKAVLPILSAHFECKANSLSS